MSMTQQQFEDALRGRIEDLKSIYSELFLLMEQSLLLEVADDAEASRELDRAIARLMVHAGNRFEEYREWIARQTKAEAALTDPLRNDVSEFETRLQSGLQMLLERVRDRAELVREEREEISRRLHEIQDRKRTRRAYRGRTNSPSTLFDSNA